MAKKVLVINSDDRGHFFLHVDGQVLTLGSGPDNAEFVIRDLHIVSIRCEVEVEEDVVVCEPAAAADEAAEAIHELRPGDAQQIGQAQLHFDVRGEATPTSRTTPTPPVASPAPSSLPAAAVGSSATLPTVTVSAGSVFKQLTVFDGADRGRSFRLPSSGTVIVGNSSKHAEVVLHDLYVSRIHCVIDIRDDKVIVTHSEGKNGTIINGQRITQQELRIGDILRVGNSHLRLETAVADQTAEEEPEEAVEEDAEAVVPFAPAEGAAQREAAPPRAAAHPPVDRAAQLEGQVLGQFRVGPLLGRGHCGLVFRAQHLSTNVVVALKVLSPDFPATGAELQRFVGALKISSGIHHANLVGVQGVGRSGPWCWIAREYVEGESAAALIQRRKEAGKFNWMRAALIAVDLGKALACLHQNKLAHGNITPRNILIQASDKTAKLADLLLVQSLEGSRLQQAIGQKKSLSELSWLAPEQVDPDAFVDRLADLYAVGAVLYALLAGQPPFVGASTEETINLIRSAKLVRPSAYLKGIPGSFESIVLKLLSRQQENRYQTAAELLADLEPIVQAQEES
jgi:pSer/pThr/pTyr-binding forkhead associated (FHA) protein